MSVPRDDFAAAGHLLRHLGEPRALRRNYLAAPFLECIRDDRSPEMRRALAMLRAHVLTVAASLKASEGAERDHGRAYRQHTILTRYDLGKQPQHLVERDLAISRGTFYNERRAALGRIARSIKAGTEAVGFNRTGDTPGDIVPNTNVVCDELDANAVRASIDAAPDDTKRIAPLTRLVMVLCARGERREAENVFARLQSLGARTDASSMESQPLEVTLAASRLALANGELAAAASQSRRVWRRALRSNRLDPDTAFMLTTSASTFARSSLKLGKTESAADVLSQSLRKLENVPGDGFIGRMRLQSLLAFALAEIPGRIGAAQFHSACSLENAHRAASPSDITFAHFVEAHIRCARGETASALTHMMLAHTLANAYLPAAHAAQISADYALFETAAGRPQLARTRLRDADLPYSDIFTAVGLVAQSNAFRAEGRFAQARRCARQAVEHQERASCPSLLARSLTAAAHSNEHLGKRNEAIADAERSLAVLDKHQHALVLAEAYQCAARLTGKSRYADCAADLYDALRAPALA